MFIYSKGGYIGVSTTLEIGAAAILGKSIYALENYKEDLAIDVLFDGIIKNPEELIEKLK